MPTLPWEGAGRAWIDWCRAQAGVVPSRSQGVTLSPSCPGNGMSLHSSTAPGSPWTRGGSGRIWNGSEVASPADVRVGRRGPCHKEVTGALLALWRLN